MPSGVEANQQSGDLVSNLFGTANTAITGYFGYESAKQLANATVKAPAANLGIVVGGVVLIGVLIVILVKKH